MLQRFVDLGIAAEIMGYDWTVGKIIKKIKEGALTAYARIHCCPKDDPIIDDSSEDENDKYEIARITNLKEKSSKQMLGHTEWFFILYEPIISAVESGELDVKYDDVERVFGCLKSRSIYTAFISTEEICLMVSDIERFLSGNEMVLNSKNQQVHERIKLQGVKHERPLQLDREGEIGPLNKLFDGAIKDYYMHKTELPGTIDALLTFIEKTYMDKFLKIKRSSTQKNPEYLSLIVRKGKADKDCLKTMIRVKPYSKPYLQRVFVKRKKLANYPSTEISPI